jgi:(2Fe-2S) ferredoxin
MKDDIPYYKLHVFLCTNLRDANRACCSQLGAAEAVAHCKSRVKALGLSGAGQIRVNSSGCLDRCEMGPTLVIYPEGTWYSYVSLEDIDDIVDQHLAKGKVVERLKI